MIARTIPEFFENMQDASRELQKAEQALELVLLKIEKETHKDEEELIANEEALYMLLQNQSSAQAEYSSAKSKYYNERRIVGLKKAWDNLKGQ